MTQPNKYEQAIRVITSEQEKIIGRSIARELVKGVQNLHFEGNSDEPNIKGGAEPKEVLENLVNQYAKLFGKASLEVSKEAIKELEFSAKELPESLK